MKVVIIFIIHLFVVGEVIAQQPGGLCIYKQIINYIKKDTDISEETHKHLAILVSPYLIETNFQTVIGRNLSALNVYKSDSLVRLLEKMDSYANLNYKPKQDSLLKTFPIEKNYNYIVYFASQYKEFIYCEAITYLKKTDSPEKYYLNYMGKVLTYMFKVHDCQIIEVKSGVFYMQ